MIFGLFDPGAAGRSARHRRIHAIYELVCTGIDFAAGLLFVIGSIFFFREESQTAGIWLFLIGSLCFVISPGLRFAREIHYWRIGDLETLAERAER